MSKVLLCLSIFTIACAPSFAQDKTFNVKELLTLKDHDIQFFRDFVTNKGYGYQRSRYDEKKQKYSYLSLADASHDLRRIVCDKTDKGNTITYGTTDSTDYQQLKKELELLGFRFVKFVPKQENGRSVLEIIYSDGNNRINLYNSYTQDDNHDFVKYYRIKVY